MNSKYFKVCSTHSAILIINTNYLFKLNVISLWFSACFNISYDPRRLSASLSGNVNQRWGFQNSISGIITETSIHVLYLLTWHLFSANNPPPFCFPIFIPGEVICITYSNVVLQPTRFQSCLDVSIRFLFATVFNFNFDCIQFSLDRGFSVTVLFIKYTQIWKLIH